MSYELLFLVVFGLLIALNVLARGFVITITIARTRDRHTGRATAARIAR